MRRLTRLMTVSLGLAAASYVGYMAWKAREMFQQEVGTTAPLTAAVPTAASTPAPVSTTPAAVKTHRQQPSRRKMANAATYQKRGTGSHPNPYKGTNANPTFFAELREQRLLILLDTLRSHVSRHGTLTLPSYRVAGIAAKIPYGTVVNLYQILHERGYIERSTSNRGNHHKWRLAPKAMTQETPTFVSPSLYQSGSH